MKLSIFKDEISRIDDIARSLRSVINGQGVAFLLPALPGDDSYNKPVMNTDWLYRSYLFICYSDCQVYNKTQIPCPILGNPFNPLEYLLKINEVLLNKVGIIPASVFFELTGFFPEDFEHRNISAVNNVISTNLDPKISRAVRKLEAGTYLFLNRIKMPLLNFIDLAPEYNDNSVDHFLFRMEKEDKYKEIRKFSINRPNYQLSFPKM